MTDLISVGSLSTRQRLSKEWQPQTPLKQRSIRLWLFFPKASSTLVSSLIISLGLVALPSSAQITINLNGVFSPRSSEHFFLQGLERFERNIEHLNTIYDAETLSEDEVSPLINPLILDDSIEQQRQKIEDDGMSEFQGFSQSSPIHKMGK